MCVCLPCCFVAGSAVIGFTCCGVPALIFVTFFLLVFAYLQCFFLFVFFRAKLIK